MNLDTLTRVVGDVAGPTPSALATVGALVPRPC